VLVERCARVRVCATSLPTSNSLIIDVQFKFSGTTLHLHIYRNAKSGLSTHTDLDNPIIKSYSHTHTPAVGAPLELEIDSFHSLLKGSPQRKQTTTRAHEGKPHNAPTHVRSNKTNIRRNKLFRVKPLHTVSNSLHF